MIGNSINAQLLRWTSPMTCYSNMAMIGFEEECRYKGVRFEWETRNYLAVPQMSTMNLDEY